jgi:pyruvate-ferredoxin/flavodoxin oxidoreductase
LADFTREEGRYEVLRRSDPERAEQLATMAQADVDERWRYYEQLAGVERTLTDDHTDERFAPEDDA